MTLLNKILAGSMLLFLAYCQAPVVFTEPQPEGVEPVSEFDAPYLGYFWCEGDSALVILSEQYLYKEKVYSFEITEEEIATDSAIELTDSLLRIDYLNETVPVEAIGDSLYTGVITLKDTIFSRGEGQVLKRYKGHHILSKRYNEERWEVMVLSMDEVGNLRLGRTALPEDLEQLKAITPVTNISSGDKEQYLVSPTRTEFSKLMDMDLFSDCDYFIRLGKKEVF